MNGNIGTMNQSLRIVMAIAAKDIGDALRNRTIVTIVLGLVFMALSTQALPLLLRLKPVPKAAIYDAGNSQLVEELAQREGLSLSLLSSPAEMERWVSESGEVTLGFALPADFDQAVSSGTRIELEGHWPYWADPDRLAETAAFFAAQFSQVTGKPVSIRTEGNAVYPYLDAGGRPFLFSMGFVIAVIMVGAMLVPYLMIEEKENQTIDTLLVSPARYSEVVLGKALAGTFYCLAAAAVLFALNHTMVTQWELAIIAVVCGSLFAVAIGLLMGILFESVASMNLWLGLVMFILLVPMYLSHTTGTRWPGMIRIIVPWIPSVALAQVFRASFSNQAPLRLILSNLGSILFIAALLLSVVVWRFRQLTY